MSNNKHTPPLSVIFSPRDAASIRAELAQHEAVIAERLNAMYGPLAVYGPAAPSANVIDMFSWKASR